MLNLLRQGKLATNSAIDALLRGIPLAERLEHLIELGVNVVQLMPIAEFSRMSLPKRRHSLSSWVCSSFQNR